MSAHTDPRYPYMTPSEVMAAERRLQALNDAYAEGRKDEREAICEALKRAGLELRERDGHEFVLNVQDWHNTSEDDYPTGQVSITPLGNGDVALIVGDTAKVKARLMAAAPELLEALRETRNALTVAIRRSLTPYDSLAEYVEGNPALQRANAAIAKATGGAQ